MAISDKIIKLNTIKNNILDAIEDKGRDLTEKDFNGYAPEILDIKTKGISSLSQVKAAWTEDSLVVNGLLVANEQPPYDRVEEEQPGMVEAGDGVGIYRELAVPPATGFLEIRFICPVLSGTKMLCGSFTNPNYFINLVDSYGTVISIVGTPDTANGTQINSAIQVVAGDIITLRVEYTATSITQIINGVVTGSSTGTVTGVPTIPIYLHGRNLNGSIDSPSDIDIAYININDEHYYAAANMYYDQIGSSHAVAYGGTPIVTAHPEGDQCINERGYTPANYVEYEYRDLTNWFSTNCSIVGNSGEWTQIALDGQDDPRQAGQEITIGDLLGKTIEISFEAYGDSGTANGDSNNFYLITKDPYNANNLTYQLTTTPTVYSRVINYTETGGQTIIEPRIDFNNNVTGNVYVKNYKIKVIDNDPEPTLTSIVPASLTDPTRDAAGSLLERAGRNAHSIILPKNVQTPIFTDGVTEYPTDINQTGNLNISDLGIIGTIPPEIGNMPNLWYLNMHNNLFVGSIPKEIGNLKQLRTLSLYNNNLTGPIPAEIGNLTILTNAYLLSNGFEGPIPVECANLTKLVLFHVANNQLTSADDFLIAAAAKVQEDQTNWNGANIELGNNNITLSTAAQNAVTTLEGNGCTVTV